MPQQCDFCFVCVLVCAIEASFQWNKRTIPCRNYSLKKKNCVCLLKFNIELWGVGLCKNPWLLSPFKSLANHIHSYGIHNFRRVNWNAESVGLHYFRLLSHCYCAFVLTHISSESVCISVSPHLTWKSKYDALVSVFITSIYDFRRNP